MARDGAEIVLDARFSFHLRAPAAGAGGVAAMSNVQCAIGDIVRYGPGETALMLIDHTAPSKGKRGGLDYCGLGCMGLRAKAHESQCRPANERDMDIWAQRMRQRSDNPHTVITGEAVRRIRLKLALTRNELARWLMLAPANAHQTVSDWEMGAKHVTGPASIALESFDAGFVPRHVRGGSSDRAPHFSTEAKTP